jgi:hypothetical protein
MSVTFEQHWEFIRSRFSDRRNSAKPAHFAGSEAHLGCPARGLFLAARHGSSARTGRIGAIPFHPEPAHPQAPGCRADPPASSTPAKPRPSTTSHLLKRLAGAIPSQGGEKRFALHRDPRDLTPGRHQQHSPKTMCQQINDRGKASLNTCTRVQVGLHAMPRDGVVQRDGRLYNVALSIVRKAQWDVPRAAAGHQCKRS